MSRRRKGVPNRFQAGWARLVCAFFDRFFWRCRVWGRRNVPKGPVILAGNHSGLLDGPVVIGASPRGVHFLIKEELAKGIGGKILLAGGQVPVDRANGHQALEVGLELLQKGRIVGIFPEGTRGDGRMEKIHAGVGWLAVHSGAPVVPFACLGTRRQGESIGHIPGFRRRLAVVFGPPLKLELSPGSTREQIGEALEQIAQGLAAHVALASERTGLVLPTDSGRKEKP
ncbi:MAG: 1-acyl-sn-glycerol-3-phosphate acyltransferase [Micrococcales bacterium]|nr:1-acyl-sn-glycerol-3-phosphate acyltransferase [Micrococcales bacterium]